MWAAGQRCGSYPDLGKIDTSGHTIFYNEGVIADLSKSDRSHLKIAPDGTSIGFHPLNQEAMTFHIKDRLLALEAASYPSAKTSHEGITITNWDDNYHPQCNGKKIAFLEKYERSRSLAIAHDGSAIVLGAEWRLYGMNKTGTLLWEQPVPGPA